MDLESILTFSTGLLMGGTIGIVGPLGIYGISSIKKRVREGNNIIAVVPIEGQISSKSGPGKIHSRKVINSIESVIKDKRIKGIVFSINSGGGVVYQSKEIAEYIRTKVKVPKVALANDVCASGAYMIACATDYIVAREESAIGSIGVISAHIAAGGLLEKFGIKYEIIKAGHDKDMHLPLETLRPEQKHFLQGQIDYIYSLFISYVSQNRGRITKRHVDENAVREIATGSVYYGNNSLQYNLIDEFGSLDAAIKSVEDIGNFRHSHIHYVTERQRPMQLLMQLFGQNMGNAIGSSLVESVKESVNEKSSLNY